MNLSSWIDLSGVFAELPIIIPLTPEGWKLPSLIGLCMCAAHIGPLLLIIIRWRQNNRFSEIPYIYIIIIIGIISCCIMAVSWQKTVVLFGRKRSIWLLSTIFTLGFLDCTSSLVYFDYMKRFRARYLSATFLGEAFTAIPPTLLAVLQGVGSEAICVQTANSTIPEATYSQPRFSSTVFLFCIAGIVFLSLIAFILLRWTNIVAMADAAEKNPLNNIKSSIEIQQHETFPMNIDIQPTQLQHTSEMSFSTLILLLSLLVFSGAILIGCLQPLITYSLLPFGQKTFYYTSILSPLAYPSACFLSFRWPTITTRTTIVETIIGVSLCIFIVCTAWQSPCPWMADTLYGSIVMVTTWFLATLILAYIRIAIGNRIKMEWIDEKGMFYFGISTELGVILGTIPMFFLVNIFQIFVERLPCQTYCKI
ncbi:unnamed protein product [Adineta steineri]|uniref:Riboflavin transporter n=1 Tax=Adineta steineri TaxID=433720 RepID=A0A819WMR9_9BILA|nr:unnamed protein product [Adineta steineri]CAF4124342.1 unnamed protein product [Adineta steineri]